MTIAFVNSSNRPAMSNTQFTEASLAPRLAGAQVSPDRGCHRRCHRHGCPPSSTGTTDAAQTCRTAHCLASSSGRSVEVVRLLAGWHPDSQRSRETHADASNRTVNRRSPPSGRTAHPPVVALPLSFVKAGERVRPRRHNVVPTIIAAAIDASRGRHD